MVRPLDFAYLMGLLTASPWLLYRALATGRYRRHPLRRLPRPGNRAAAAAGAGRGRAVAEHAARGQGPPRACGGGQRPAQPALRPPLPALRLVRPADAPVGGPVRRADGGVRPGAQG